MRRAGRQSLPDLPEGMPLNPPVTVTSFTRTDADTRFQGDDDIYDNISLRYHKALFGIDYEIPWTYVRGEELDQKMNLALAAGDIPEFMPGIGLSMFQDMVAGDLVADITDAYEATADPKWVKRVARMGRSPAVGLCRGGRPQDGVPEGCPGGPK